MLLSWKLTLDAANKSPKAIISYLDSAKRLEAYPAAEGLPMKASGIPGSRARPSETGRGRCAATRYRSLCVYFHWLMAEQDQGRPDGTATRRSS